jgi:5-methylphenazine-1-carboxylate 1-monooxygenase
MSMRIAIVGGGIVGLTSALSLARAGFRPIVYEAVATPAPLGVGINLLPHAVRELAELGVLDRLMCLGVPISELVYRMDDGREVWREPRGLAAGYSWPQLAIHRGALQMFLLNEVRAALGPDAVRFGHALDTLTSRPDGASLGFIDRSSGAPRGAVEADLVIGADGIHSAVRRHFYPSEGIPKWNGISLYRGTSTLPAGSLGPVMQWAGHSRQKFVGYPIAIEPGSGEILFNWICDLPSGNPGDTPREDWNRRADPAVIRHRYRDWRWPGIDVPSIIASAAQVMEFPMVDRDPLPRWTFDRVTLAGDAAHPMYPIGSNGATQGIIDGRALAYFLATEPDPGAALERYEEERRPPTREIVLTNRAHGPDRVLEVARERAPDATIDLDAVFPIVERAEIARGYKALAGFDPAQLAARRSYRPH